MTASLEELRRSIGLNIVYYRKARRMTQLELASAMDLSSSYLSQIETGIRNVSLPVLAKLAAVLGVEVADLMEVRRLKATQ